MKYINYVVVMLFVLAACTTAIKAPAAVELMNDAGTEVAVTCEYTGVHTSEDFHIYICRMEGIASPFNLRFKK